MSYRSQHSSSRGQTKASGSKPSDRAQIATNQARVQQIKQWLRPGPVQKRTRPDQFGHIAAAFRQEGLEPGELTRLFDAYERGEPLGSYIPESEFQKLSIPQILAHPRFMPWIPTLLARQVMQGKHVVAINRSTMIGFPAGAIGELTRELGQVNLRLEELSKNEAHEETWQRALVAPERSQLRRRKIQILQELSEAEQARYQAGKSKSLAEQLSQSNARTETLMRELSELRDKHTLLARQMGEALSQTGLDGPVPQTPIRKVDDSIGRIEALEQQLASEKQHGEALQVRLSLVEAGHRDLPEIDPGPSRKIPIHGPVAKADAAFRAGVQGGAADLLHLAAWIQKYSPHEMVGSIVRTIAGDTAEPKFSLASSTRRLARNLDDRATRNHEMAGGEVPELVIEGLTKVLVIYAPLALIGGGGAAASTRLGLGAMAGRSAGFGFAGAGMASDKDARKMAETGLLFALFPPVLGKLDAAVWPVRWGSFSAGLGSIAFLKTADWDGFFALLASGRESEAVPYLLGSCDPKLVKAQAIVGGILAVMNEPIRAMDSDTPGGPGNSPKIQHEPPATQLTGRLGLKGDRIPEPEPIEMMKVVEDGKITYVAAPRPSQSDIATNAQTQPTEPTAAPSRPDTPRVPPRLLAAPRPSLALRLAQSLSRFTNQLDFLNRFHRMDGWDGIEIHRLARYWREHGEVNGGQYEDFFSSYSAGRGLDWLSVRFGGNFDSAQNFLAQLLASLRSAIAMQNSSSDAGVATPAQSQPASLSASSQEDAPQANRSVSRLSNSLRLQELDRQELNLKGKIKNFEQSRSPENDPSTQENQLRDQLDNVQTERHFLELLDREQPVPDWTLREVGRDILNPDLPLGYVRESAGVDWIYNEAISQAERGIALHGKYALDAARRELSEAQKAAAGMKPILPGATGSSTELAKRALKNHQIELRLQEAERQVRALGQGDFSQVPTVVEKQHDREQAHRAVWKADLKRVEQYVATTGATAIDQEPDWAAMSIAEIINYFRLQFGLSLRTRHAAWSQTEIVDVAQTLWQMGPAALTDLRAITRTTKVSKHEDKAHVAGRYDNLEKAIELGDKAFIGLFRLTSPSALSATPTPQGREVTAHEVGHHMASHSNDGDKISSVGWRVLTGAQLRTELKSAGMNPNDIDVSMERLLAPRTANYSKQASLCFAGTQYLLYPYGSKHEGQKFVGYHYGTLGGDWTVQSGRPFFTTLDETFANLQHQPALGLPGAKLEIAQHRDPRHDFWLYAGTTFEEQQAELVSFAVNAPQVLFKLLIEEPYEAEQYWKRQVDSAALALRAAGISEQHVFARVQSDTDPSGWTEVEANYAFARHYLGLASRDAHAKEEQWNTVRSVRFGVSHEWEGALAFSLPVPARAQFLKEAERLVVPAQIVECYNRIARENGVATIGAAGGKSPADAKQFFSTNKNTKAEYDRQVKRTFTDQGELHRELIDVPQQELTNAKLKRDEVTQNSPEWIARDRRVDAFQRRVRNGDALWNMLRREHGISHEEIARIVEVMTAHAPAAIQAQVLAIAKRFSEQAVTIVSRAALNQLILRTLAQIREVESSSNPR